MPDKLVAVPASSIPVVASVVAGPKPAVLQAIANPAVGLALWWRTGCPSILPLIDQLTSGAAFNHEGIGDPAAAVDLVLRAVPRAAGVLRPDLLGLATLLAALSDCSILRVGLTLTRRQSCPKLHVDAVGLRLLCTYAGRGTEWQDANGTVRRMPEHHVGVFKGTRWPDEAPRILHRSPGVADLPTRQRGRLLLCIDRMGLDH